MKSINWTFVFVAIIVGAGAVSVALGLTDALDKSKKNKTELKSELSITYKRVQSDCKPISKEKQFDMYGSSTIIERYSCADGIDYSFSIPSESN